MLRCLTKSKVDCSFQNNEFRFKNRGFLFFFLVFFFFFSFLRSTLDEITKRYVKNYGGVFEKKRKKRRKNTVLMEKRKKIQKKKKARTGFEPAIFGSIGESSKPPLYETDALPLGHRAPPQICIAIKIIKTNTHNALGASTSVITDPPFSLQSP